MFFSTAFHALEFAFEIMSFVFTPLAFCVRFYKGTF